MKTILRACILLLLLPAIAGAWSFCPAQGAPASTCTTRFSDTFTRADSSTVGNGWTEGSGSHSIASNALYTEASGIGALAQATEFTTSIQWIKVKTVSSTYFGVGFRADTSDYNPFYELDCNASGVEWLVNGSTSIQTSAAVTCSAGDSIAEMATGTGDGTVISIWKNPTNNSPLSGGSACTNTAQPCWDNADDAPDLQLTNNPSTPADSGMGMLLFNYDDASSLDDVTMGDCAS